MGTEESLYEALLQLFKRMGFSHLVSDDLAERAADVAHTWYERDRGDANARELA